MSELKRLLSQLSGLEGCSVDYSAATISPENLEEAYGVALPNDLREFVNLCNGVHLFEYAECPIHILGLDRMHRSNTVIRGVDGEGHPSYSWFLIADLENGDYVSIDLAPERSGKCYQSFWTTHSLVGQSPIVATSFTDFLRRAIANGGDYYWWLKEGFHRLGDAYDA